MQQRIFSERIQFGLHSSKILTINGIKTIDKRSKKGKPKTEATNSNNSTDTIKLHNRAHVNSSTIVPRFAICNDENVNNSVTFHFVVFLFAFGFDF